VCTDCNLPLELPPGEALAGDERARGAIRDAVALSFDRAGALVELAEALQQRGISSEIGPHARGNERLAIYVGRDDYEAARAVAEERITRSMPEVLEAPDYGPGTCPACGEPTPEHAAACASCGLEFPEIPGDGR